jgi:hypothetical protein
VRTLRLGPPSECSPVALVGKSDLLSWDSSRHADLRPHGSRHEVDLADLAACAAPRSSGVVTPLHRHPFRASTPPNRHCCRPGSVPRLPASESCFALVVSHHLGDFLRSGGCGLVASRCQSWGSSRFLSSGSGSTRLPGEPGFRTVGVPMHSPRRFSHPSKDSPRPQPHHVTVAVAPLPFPPARLPSPNRLRCQNRPLEACLTGAPASRPCSAVGSVTLSGRCQPASALSFLGFVPLQGPSRGSRTPASTRSLPCTAAESEKTATFTGAPFRIQETCASRTTPTASLRRATGGDGHIGMRPKTLAVAHLAPDIEEIPRDLSDREAPGRPKPPGASHRGPPARRRKVRGSMRTESLLRFTENRDESRVLPGPDRSQDPGAPVASEARVRASADVKSVQS